MRLNDLVRRSVAVAATTALLGAGGLVSGLVSPAHAAACDVGDTGPCVTGISTPVAFNSSGVQPEIHITGSGLFNATDTKVTVTFTPVGAPSAAWDASVTTGLQSGPTQSTASSLYVKPDLSFVPPGRYSVKVVRSTFPTGTLTSNDCGEAQGCSFYIYNDGAAADTSSSQLGASGTLGHLAIKGKDFAQGARVVFKKASDHSVDTGLVFTPGNETVGTTTESLDPAGYKLAAGDDELHGTYVPTAATLTPGEHELHVVNSDNDDSGTFSTFWQPKFLAAGVSPSSLAAGSTQTVTVTGEGIGAGSTLVIQGLSADNTACPFADEVKVTNPVVNATHTVLTATVALASCAPTGTRDISVLGPEGAFFTVAGGLTTTIAPTVTKVNNVALASPGYKVGQGAEIDIPVTGTDFATGNTVAALPAFDFGPSTTSVSTVDAANSTTQVLTHLSVGYTAALGDRTVKVTNPNKGSSTTTKAGITVTAGPTVDPSSVENASGTAGSTVNVKLHGLNFDQTNGMEAKVVNGTNPDGSLKYETTWTVVTGTVVAGSPGSVTVAITIPSGTAPGLRSIRLRNKGDNGAVLCQDCFGIDSLSVVDAATGDPRAAGNGTKNLRLTGIGLALNQTVTLVNVADPTAENTYTGTITSMPSAGVGIAAVNISAARPGRYRATVGSLTCVQCFTIDATPVDLVSVSPHTIGQGAVDVPITLTGAADKTFHHGSNVTIAGATVKDVTWVNETTLTAKVTVAANTNTGTVSVTVTTADGASSDSLSDATSGMSVTAGPAFGATTPVTPATLGQGAGTQTASSTETVTITGAKFVKGATAADPSTTVDFGAGIDVISVTVTDGGPAPTLPPGPEPADTLVATIRVTPSAAVGGHNVTLTNPDKGRAVLTNGFTVATGPKVTSVSPAVLAPGTSSAVLTINGTGFPTSSANLTLAIPGLTLTEVTPSSDGTRITAKATVTDGSIGVRNVSVTNTADKGYGVCPGCLAIATKPNVPQNFGLVVGGSALTASWGAPTSDGGSPITKYEATVTLTDGTFVKTASVDGSTFSTAITGLTNGVTYSVTLKAFNQVGASDPTAAVLATPGFAVSLTSVRNKSLVTYGSPVVYSGRLYRGTTGIAGQAIRLTFTPAYGSRFVQTVTTSSTGTWSFTYKPLTPTATFKSVSAYNVTMVASYAGNVTYLGKSAPGVGVQVAALVKRSSPTNGSRSKATTTLTITGTVGPNKAGKVVYLYRFTSRGKVLLAKTTVSSRSTFVFSLKPGKGTYSLRVYIPNTYVGSRLVNTAAYSAAFTLYRV